MSAFLVDPTVLHRGRVMGGRNPRAVIWCMHSNEFLLFTSAGIFQKVKDKFLFSFAVIRSGLSKNYPFFKLQTNCMDDIMLEIKC